MNKRFPLGPTAGFAILVVLAALVLVSVVVMSFFTATSSNRLIANSNVTRFQAEQAARLGAETVLGDLQAEIAAGSETPKDPAYPTYLPKANSAAVPFRHNTLGSGNVVKISVANRPFWEGTVYNTNVPAPMRSAAGNNSVTPAKNGRFIVAERWNAPYLLGATLPSNFSAPDWVVITRKGAVRDATAMPTLSALSNRTASNSDYAVGRFAYIVYDEGGLLDVNVAGYPSGMDTSFISRRGLLPQVDLGRIPGVLDAEALVQWRNKTTGASHDVYRTRVFNESEGFRTVAEGDQAFVSRKDLIQFAKAHPDALGLEGLQYLSTFTRELSAPSFTPDPNRPKSGTADDSFNPSLPEVKVTDEFTRLDGTPARIGEPLVKGRFPLSRLALVTHSAIATTDSPIFRYFGLSRASASAPWVYRSGASRILTLAEVADAGREADFFELLQAGILSGSLGKSAGDWASEIQGLDANSYHQLIAIGANIIDQYDTDSWPTRISLGGREFVGIENLPYLMRVIEQPYRASADGSGVGKLPAGYSEIHSAWYRPEIWNPHATYLSSAPPGSDAPSSFRYRVAGKASVQLFTVEDGGYTPVAASGANDFAEATSTISFSASTLYTMPTFLDPLPNLIAPGRNTMVDGVKKFVGVWVGDVVARDSRIFPAEMNIFRRSYIMPDANDKVEHQLQYWDGSQWITHSAIRAVTGGAATVDDGSASESQYANYWANLHDRPYNLRSDPRTDRFGVGRSADLIEAGKTIRPYSTPGAMLYGVSASPGWSFSAVAADGTASMYPGLLADNRSGTNTYYADRDGVVRRGDGAYTYVMPYMSHGGFVLAADPEYSRSKSRPILLNRPFRSVAELGYAFRDMPWKHLDFFTAESADAGLLDLFCLNEVPADGIEAGRLNLNTRHASVLEAVLTGINRREEPGGAPGEIAEAGGVVIPGSEAATLTASLMAITGDPARGPLRNRSELVTRWIGDVNAVPINDSDAEAALNGRIKRRREASIRALADVGNTRTWNLMIDVIAQAGNYSTSATNLAEFSVTGEHRAWLHVALDRYTGKVIDYHMEVVSE